MKPKTLLLLIVAIPILAYGLAYGSVWLQTRASLNRFAEAIAPLADFRYGSIRIGPSGTIAVTNLLLSPRQFEDRIRIDQVALKTPGIDFILHGSKSLREGKIPRRLGLAFTGVRIAADGPIWQQVSKLAGKERPQPDNGLACGIAGIARMEGVLKTLMPTQIVTDLEVLMQTGERPGTASIHLQWRQHGFAALEVDLDYRKVGDLLVNLGTAATLDTIVATASLDPTYAREAVKLCADESRLPVERFLPALLAQNDRAYLQDLGLIPGSGIRGALDGFLGGGAKVKAQIAVPEGFDLASVKNYRPEDVPRLLEMQLALDGVPVADLSATTKPAPEAAATPSAGGQPSRPPAGASPAELTVADLAQCLGCRVLLTLRDGHQRRGTIDSVKSGFIYLRQERQEGSVIMTIGTKEVVKLRRLDARP